MTDKQFKTLSLFPMGVVFVAATAFVMIKTGRDTLFFQD